MASSSDAARMGESLPRDFVDIDRSSKIPDRLFNVMGVICDYLAPSRTRGTDTQITFTIVDLSTNSSITVPNGLRVKFFRANETELPKIQGKGDVILLRNLKVSRYREQIVGVSTWNTTWIVFPGSSIPAQEFRNAYATRERSLPHVGIPGFMRKKGYEQEHEPSLHEQQWAITLHNRFPELSTVTQSYSNPPTSLPSGASLIAGSSSLLASESSGFRNVNSKEIESESTISTSKEPRQTARISVAPRYDKFSLLKDVEVNKFYDLAVQVVKKFDSGSEVLELYVTDYTHNKSFRNYQDEQSSNAYNDWNGPPGKMTLKVEVMAPHTSWAQKHVEVGSFVLLRNVRVKLSNSAEIEGNLWQDKFNQNRINISLLEMSDSRIAGLLDRKLAAQKAAARKQLGSGRSNRNKNNKSKNTRKAEAGQERSALCDLETTAKLKSAKTTEGSILSKEFELNQHIKVVKTDNTARAIPLSEIINFDRSYKTLKGNMYKLPFVNFKAYTTVRVVDYFPHDLTKFTIMKHGSNASESDLSQSDGHRWQWHFSLLLEDALFATTQSKPASAPLARLPVLVSGKDGAFLLNLDAKDLSTSTEALQHLKERLFLLWGDLEEQKSAAIASIGTDPDEKDDTSSYSSKITPRGRPFTCCIGEFGVRRSASLDDRLRPEGEDANSCEESIPGWERCHRMCMVTIQS